VKASACARVVAAGSLEYHCASAVFTVEGAYLEHEHTQGEGVCLCQGRGGRLAGVPLRLGGVHSAVRIHRHSHLRTVAWHMGDNGSMPCQ
jgi:hypothetical protein